MPPPLRKPRQKSAPASNDKRRFTLRLSAPMLSLLGVVLMAAVGWSFFMGFMVGRGQNPEQRVEQITGLQLDGRNRPNTVDGQPGLETAKPGDTAASGIQAGSEAATGAGTEAGTEAGPGASADAGAVAADAAQPAGTSAAAPQGGQTGHNARTRQAAAPAAGAPAGSRETAAQSPDYPFERPSGDSLAAWGIKQPRSGAQNSGQPAAPPPSSARTAAAPGAAPNQGQAPGATVTQEQIYDYVFQAAAFKGEDDADRLRKRLEGRGLRTRLQKSGKVQLVMINLRGTERDADNLREELKRMKLGAPIQTSKKAVPGKSRKTVR